MGIKLLHKAGILLAKDIILRSVSHISQAATKIVNVPMGYLAVYVGETQKKKILVLISYLNQPLFQDLLHKAEEEFRFTHLMGGLTIPYGEDTFLNLLLSEEARSRSRGCALGEAHPYDLNRQKTTGRYFSQSYFSV